MIYVLFVLLVIIVFAKMADFNSSIERLRSEINKLKQIGGAVDVGAVSGQSPLQNQVYSAGQSEGQFQNNHSSDSKLSPLPSKSETYDYQHPEVSDVFLNWLKENWLLKIGVLMILVGFGWFVSYAFIHEWIGPLGRISIGIIAGALIAVFGTMRLGKNLTQGISFTILGSALVIISVLAGQYLYLFFTPMLVLGIIFIISFYVSFTALAYSTEKLAIYGLLIALFAPLLSHVSLDFDPVSMYIYLLVIAVSTVWISVVKGWRLGNPVGVIGVLMYSLPIFMGQHDHFLDDSTKYLTLLIAFIISFLYLFVSAWSLINKDKKLEWKTSSREGRVHDLGRASCVEDSEIGATTNDVFLTIVSTIIILGFTLSLVPTAYQSLVLVFWMLVYAASGFIVFQSTKNEKLFYIHSLVAILFLAIATSIELSGKTLIIIFAIEAAVISIASFLVTNKIKTSQNFGLLMIAPMVMSLDSIASSNWQYGSGDVSAIFNVDFFVLLVLGLILGGLGLFYGSNRSSDGGVETAETVRITGIISSGFSFEIYHLAFIFSTIYFYIIIWLSAHLAIYNQATAVLISLIIYTIVGLFSYFVGLFNGNNVVKKYGAVLLILVVLRLVLVDVWSMELSLRVVTFIVLGVMFISTAFISKNRKNEINEGTKPLA